MNNKELEAAASKTAYPWECIVCFKTFHYRPHKDTAFGPVCADCWQKNKERAYEEVEREYGKTSTSI